MATLADVAQISRRLGGVDVNAITNSMVVDFSNVARTKIRQKLIANGVDVAPIREAVHSITDGVGTYLYPDDMYYTPKYIELNWFESVVTTAKFVQAEKVTESNLPQGQSLSYLRVNQPAEHPMVDYRGDYFEILPTPNSDTWQGASGSVLSNALRVIYYIKDIVYTQVTDTLAYPESADYFSFSDVVRNLYLYSIEKIDKPILDASVDAEANRLIRIAKGDGPSPTKPKGLGITGWEF